MRSVLEPIARLVPSFEYVSIDGDAVARYAATIQPEDLQDSQFQDGLELTPEQHVAFVFVYDAMNFSFWGNPKWEVDIDGQQFGGSMGLLRALRRGIRQVPELLDAQYLAQLDAQTLADILHGNEEIPLLTERLQFLRELGQYIVEKYDGSFANFVAAADWDSEKLVNKLVAEMPRVFDDSGIYHGEAVHFFKRAQLVPNNLHDLARQGLLPRDLSGVDTLTAFADYKVPQILRALGILICSVTLADKIDHHVEISAGSDEELEIRMATIRAVQLFVEALRPRIPDVTAPNVDGLLWRRSRLPDMQTHPHHETRTTNY